MRSIAVRHVRGDAVTAVKHIFEVRQGQHVHPVFNDLLLNEMLIWWTTTGFRFHEAGSLLRCFDEFLLIGVEHLR